jgi:DNA-binding transcriptional MocR family regulator
MRQTISALEERLDEPTARGLATAVSRAIRDDVLPPGSKLPPIRLLAKELGLSPTTVSAAWALLTRSGRLETSGRRGTTVTRLHSAGPARYQRALERQTAFDLDLSTGVPDAALLPDLRHALNRLTTAGTPGSYLDDPVLPELRRVLREQWPYDADALTIVDGAMDGLELVTRACIRYGDAVLVEDPCFPPLLDLLESVGAKVTGIPLDDEGLCPVPFAAALTTQVAAVFLQPRAQNPTGASHTPRRLRQLADLAAAGNALLVEDDSAGAIASTEGLSLGRWIPERTIHIRSFSKSHGPDLRLAAVSGPTSLIDDLTARRHLGQGWSSRLLQAILLDLLTHAESRAQVDAARVEYARRRQAMVDALHGHGIEVGGTDGLNIWLPVADETAALVRLASQGIGVAAGTPFSPSATGGGHVRVTTGLLRARHDEVAQQLADAASLQSLGLRGP